MDSDKKRSAASRKGQPFSVLHDKLISLAGLIGKEVVNQEGQQLGAVIDLVFHWGGREKYPSLAGVVARVDRRKVWIGAVSIAKIKPTKIELHSAKLDLREYRTREGEVSLAAEVLDHQLIDVDGARVVRASDLYIASIGNEFRLVGVDVSFRSIFRRLGPSRFRSRPTPDVVIDWATIQSFGGQSGSKKNLMLAANSHELHRLRPGELADLLEDLGRDERRELLMQLPAGQAADALEEMEASEVEVILRESSISEAGTYLSHMEPDEAADALRDMDNELRQELLANMTKDSAEKVEEVLTYDEDMAGGFMNTSLLVLQGNETVATVMSILETSELSVGEIESVAIVDAQGKLIYDLPLIELLMADQTARLDSQIRPPEPVTVRPDASIKQVAELLVESRRSSILVLDEDRKPLGRIFADDVVDALLPNAGKFHFPRILT